MKIIFVSNKPFPEFEIYEENKMVIHIKIDTQTQAFRVKCLGNRRVFFIEDEVIRKTEITTLLNEYSQQLGFLTRNKLDINSGEIEIEGDQYSYRLNDDLLKEINLFELNNYQPVLSCKIEAGQLSILNKDYINYLLFALAWFTFLSKEQTSYAQFAEA
jgi:hypothetical protein